MARELLRAGVDIGRVEELVVDRSVVREEARALLKSDARPSLARPSSAAMARGPSGEGEAPPFLGAALLQRSVSAQQDDQLVEKLLDALEDTPPDLVCPISQDIMIDPVIVSSGHTFDRESVLFENGRLRLSVCPLTRAALKPDVYPCVVMRERSVELRLSRLAELVATAETIAPWDHRNFEKAAIMAASLLESLGAGR